MRQFGNLLQEGGVINAGIGPRLNFDEKAGKMYWSDDDEQNGKVLRSNLDSSAIE